MPSFHTTATRARTLLVDATVIAALIDAALPALDAALAGWPTQTPGAAPADPAPILECSHPDCTNTEPCEVHNPPGKDTSTERGALSHDKAAADLAAIHDQIRKATHHAALASRLVARWAYDGVTQSSVKERLAAFDADIWCRNCHRYGQKNPKHEDHSECWFCRSFKAKYGLSPDRAIWDARDARQGKISENTIERLLDRDHAGWRKKKPKEKSAGSPTQAGAA